MKVFLVHQGISEALDEEAMNMLEDKKKKNEIEAKAHSAILLSLGDEVLREVADEEEAIGLWNKLASIYMKKSLANKLYLKKRLYTLRMDETRELRKHLDDRQARDHLAAAPGSAAIPPPRSPPLSAGTS